MIVTGQLEPECAIGDSLHGACVAGCYPIDQRRDGWFARAGRRVFAQGRGGVKVGSMVALIRCSTSMIAPGIRREYGQEIVLDEPDLDAVCRLYMFGILHRERGVCRADDDRAGL
ncbi:hypothetical protein WJ58_04500 [Burkholderia ubonensis]|nr:hypothetical protein WJ58_04500 [Burkholderia ubonensis]